MSKSSLGRKNLITDVNGIIVGCSEDKILSTGVTVISGKNPLVAAVDVRGGGPGTKETDILNLDSSVGRADAIVLSGGSAFGLDASAEIQRLLKIDDKGYSVNGNVIPLVPSAVIFDLKPQNNYWHKNKSIWNKLAKKAYFNMNTNFALGSKGAGFGAKTSTVKGGLGSASYVHYFENKKKYTVGAIVVNNAVGNPLKNKGPHFLSGQLEIEEEFGGLGASNEIYDQVIRAKRIKKDADQLNTVIGAVATDAPLDRIDLKRIAIMSHDGIARSVHPSHTPMDGDTIFAMSTYPKIVSSDNKINKSELTILGAIAADCIARACNRAIYEATRVDDDKPSWKELFKNRFKS